MAKKEMKPTNVIDLTIADASDEDLRAILEVRKKYDKDERVQLIKGLVYVAQIDGDYSEFEKEIVESTSCTLGINRDKLDEIFDEIRNKASNVLFTPIKNAKFKEAFLKELISLTYIKGYQTQDEDDELRKIAGFVGIQDICFECIDTGRIFSCTKYHL